jgi:hypothetical protein
VRFSPRLASQGGVERSTALGLKGNERGTDP